MIKNIDERIIAEGFHTGHEVDVVTIQKSDYEHLKEQAERALGIELELLNMELTDALKQNKRYREAIVRAKTLLANIGDDTSSKMSAISILTKALEESE